eukprot:18199_5
MGSRSRCLSCSQRLAQDGISTGDPRTSSAWSGENPGIVSLGSRILHGLLSWTRPHLHRGAATGLKVVSSMQESKRLCLSECPWWRSSGRVVRLLWASSSAQTDTRKFSLWPAWVSLSKWIPESRVFATYQLQQPQKTLPSQSLIWWTRTHEYRSIQACQRRDRDRMKLV